MRRASIRGQGGYTLVELIIATALGALVMSALASVIVTTFLSANVATTRVEAGSQVRLFQLAAYDDIALSATPATPGCGASDNPCTTQAMVLSGTRVPNQPTGAATPFTVSYVWDPVQETVTREVQGGPSRVVASNVTSYSWYLDQSGSRPSIVVSLTVTIATYNTSYSESQSLRFTPQLSGP